MSAPAAAAAAPEGQAASPAPAAELAPAPAAAAAPAPAPVSASASAPAMAAAAAAQLLKPSHPWSCLVLGGSGATGRVLVAKLANNPRVDRIGLLVRKELPADYFGVQLPANVAKIQQTVVDFEQLDSSRDAFNGFPVAFSCLGSTRSKAGSKENFRHIDYDYNTHAAALAKAAGVRHFHLMSTTGADAKSSFHYLRTKGEIEENLRTQVQFPTLAVYRPGVLLTERPEKRWGEWFAQKLLPVFAPLLPEKNRAVHTLTVAEAMMQHAEHVLAVEEQRQQGNAPVAAAAAAGAAPADAAAAAAPPAPTATIFENDEIRQLKVGRL